MNITTKDVQILLSDAGYYNSSLDNDFGPKTQSGVEKVLANHNPDIPSNASWPRKGIAALQLILKNAGYPDVGAIDGYSGPNTQNALEEYYEFKFRGKKPDTDWRLDEKAAEEPEEQVELDVWPRQRDMEKIFGKAGGSQCTAGRVKLPFSMRLAWARNQTISSIRCHEKVADSAQRCLNRVSEHYSPEEISKHGFDIFSGCYNFRKKRGGRTLSTHAYGIAFDFDNQRNGLRWNHTRAYLAKPECEEFWKCWEADGWLSLGRARDFDWMHVQAARL